jgi:TRAP-type C4-dicarboxylate transport system permease small subunit
MVRRLLDFLYWLSGVLAGLFLVLIFLIMMALSVGRQVGVNFPSADDFASWSMAALAFLGLAHTFKSGDMIRVELLFERFRGRTRQVMELTSLAIAIAMVGFFAWHTVKFNVDSWRFGDISQGVVVVPMWIPQLGYSAGLVILVVALVDEFVRVLGGLKPTYEREPPKTAEEVIERAMQTGV